MPGGMIVGSRFERLSERERLGELNRLIRQWREPGLVRVLPERVVPDTTNREGTGLSVMHVHYLACDMQRNGFAPRDDATGAGHDLPIFVRERTGAASELGSQSLSKWSAAQDDDPEYPPTQPWARREGEEYFCSLGNGHFFQALNLFGTASRCRFADDPPQGSDGSAWPQEYSMRGDDPLSCAVTQGVRGVVLRRDMPKDERKFVAQMLNAAYEYMWVTDPATGDVRVDIEREIRSFTSFDGLIKHADAWQLDELIEMRMRRDAQAGVVSGAS